MKASPILALLLASAAVSACALLPKHHAVTKITPVSTPIAKADRPDDGAYADAVRAIDARDYATALDELEIARQQDANDIRVLNAFGVVYDKLGRFDLSGRYYGLAAAVDPASEIVQHNVAYSALLQSKAHPGAAGPALAAASPKPAARGRLVELAPGVSRLEGPIGAPLIALAAAPQNPVTPSRLVEIAPGVLRLEGPIGAPPQIALPRGITGHALALVDASGARAMEPVRVQLTRLGWTAPRLAERQAPTQAHSEIVYPIAAKVVALALARTLPQRVDMVVCADGCQGVRLVLGSDSAGWKHRGARDAVHRA